MYRKTFWMVLRAELSTCIRMVTTMCILIHDMTDKWNDKRNMWRTNHTFLYPCCVQKIMSNNFRLMFISCIVMESWQILRISHAKPTETIYKSNMSMGYILQWRHVSVMAYQISLFSLMIISMFSITLRCEEHVESVSISWYHYVHIPMTGHFKWLQMPCAATRLSV